MTRTGEAGGWDFAEALHELVLTHGPDDFTRDEKEALFDALANKAIAEVIAIGRARKAIPQPTGES